MRIMFRRNCSYSFHKISVLKTKFVFQLFFRLISSKFPLTLSRSRYTRDKFIKYFKKLPTKLPKRNFFLNSFRSTLYVSSICSIYNRKSINIILYKYLLFPIKWLNINNIYNWFRVICIINHINLLATVCMEETRIPV